MTIQFFETLHLLGSSNRRGRVHLRVSTICEVTRGHGSVITQFRAKPGGWVLTINIDSYRCSTCGGDASKFLQFMALEDGTSVIGECISNHYLDEHHQLTPAQEGALRSIGWNDPLPPQDPNWFFEANSSADLVTLDEMTNRTLREVFQLHDSDQVEVSFYKIAVKARVNDHDDVCS
jgi:hypothetical protein